MTWFAGTHACMHMANYIITTPYIYSLITVIDSLISSDPRQDKEYNYSNIMHALVPQDLLFFWSLLYWLGYIFRIPNNLTAAHYCL